MRREPVVLLDLCTPACRLGRGWSAGRRRERGRGASGLIVRRAEDGPGRVGNATLPLSSQARLMFGGEGTLYALTSGGTTGMLWALVPTLASGTTIDEDVFSPTHLRIAGALRAEAAAGGGVALAPGARMEAGSSITLRRDLPVQAQAAN